MEPMLGLSHTFEHVYVIELVRSCVRSHVIGFWWAHIGPIWWLYWAYAWPMLSKKYLHFIGLMFKQFQPRPKTQT